ncbi:MAG: hypothetical protein J6T88_06930 [Bacteroidales bacterium]|nr:hypothetical protein [Bacteroidales bacterium]
MKRTHILLTLLVSIFCLATVSCRDKEKDYTFGGEMEPLSYGDDSKTYIGHAEEWIYWEQGDQIKVFLGDEEHSGPADAISGFNTLMARFKGRVPEPSGVTQVYAIYPYESAIDGQGWSKLVFPAEQPYRSGETATAPHHPDSSFGRGAMPMVAWESKGIEYPIYFHAVSGILRIQIYSNDTKNLKSIQFKEVGRDAGKATYNKQISGQFTINDINQNMPYLTPTKTGAALNGEDPDRIITITDINLANVQVGADKLLTFYLPLPATGFNNVETYVLEMTVTADDNTQFKKGIIADIHRRNITMMRALKCESWDASSGSASQQIVGSGTKDRPFQIYTAEELKLVRDAFNAGGTVRINGQEVHGMPVNPGDPEPTYFKIVRSDIKLVTETAYDALTADQKKKAVIWDAGINNFKGYMYFASSTATNGGITNESDFPLFTSIASNGKVERVFIKGTSTPNVSSPYSPMCITNNGEMLECHNKCNVTLSVNQPLAGLCVYNYGKIDGGANEANLQTLGNVSGICHDNTADGIIQGNFSLSVAVPRGSNVGGICYNNAGMVKDCQVSASVRNIEETSNWGVVCYRNDGTIDNCRSTGTIVYIIHGSVGGICNINNKTVKNCTNNVEIRASEGNVGGVVATMNNVNAEVYNCCTTAPFIIGEVEGNVATNCGGVVGQLQKGVVYNCYNTSSVFGATNSGGMIGNLDNDPAADVQNCWSAQGHNFVGSYEEGAAVGNFCFSATLTASQCNIIYGPTDPDHTPYYVKTMRNQTLGGEVDPASYVGHHCGEALNDWVTWRATQSDNRVYYTWRVPTAAEIQAGAVVRPVFNTGMPGGGKKGRSRR